MSIDQARASLVCHIKLYGQPPRTPTSRLNEPPPNKTPPIIEQSKKDKRDKCTFDSQDFLSKVKFTNAVDSTHQQSGKQIHQARLERLRETSDLFLARTNWMYSPMEKILKFDESSTLY